MFPLTRRCVLVFFSIGLFGACATTAAAKGASSGKERRILAWIDSHTDEAIAFLETTVNVNSGTMNAVGIRKVGQIYRSAFDKLGMDTEWIEMPKQMNRAGHLIAKTKGKGGKRVLLIGHLDTVFEPDSPFQRFERVGGDPNLATGPGVIDIKGGNMVILFALRALHQAGLLDKLAITVLLTGDEEDPGSPLADARAALLAAAGKSHVALGFESLVDHVDTATTARRGYVLWFLKVAGKGGHSSQIFGETYGAGAIFEAARILDRFREELSRQPNLTFSPGRILGGTSITHDHQAATGTVMGKPNVIAKVAEAAGDLRALSLDQLEQTKASMQRIVSQSLPQTSATIEFDQRYPPMAPTEANLKLLAVLDQINRDLGRGPIEAVHPMRRGAADISFVAPLIPSMDGLGLLGTGDHSPSEQVDLRSVPIAIKRAALLLLRLGSMPANAAL